MGNTIEVFGDKLRADREDRKYSREAFVAHIQETTRRSLSVATLRRAETGKATLQSLKQIALALGFPHQRYIAGVEGGEKDRILFDLNGEWIAYYVEDDVSTEPYVATESLYVRQDGAKISGLYEPLSNQHPQGYRGTAAFVMEGVVMGNLLMGQYYVENSPHLRGAGVFQLMLLRNGAWAEGFCTFLADDNKIMATPNIWLRKDSNEFPIMKSQADQVFRTAKPLFKAPFSN